MEGSVRVLEGGDLSAFADLFREAWPDIVPSPESAGRGMEGSIEELWFDASQKARWHLGYWEGGRLLGLLTAYPAVGGPVLEFMAVRDGCRGQGIGSALLSELFSMTGGEIEVRTWSTNAAALEFYGKHGFREVRRVADHRGPGVGSVWLTRGAGG